MPNLFVEIGPADFCLGWLWTNILSIFTSYLELQLWATTWYLTCLLGFDPALGQSLFTIFRFLPGLSHRGIWKVHNFLILGVHPAEFDLSVRGLWAWTFGQCRNSWDFGDKLNAFHIVTGTWTFGSQGKNTDLDTECSSKAHVLRGG
jgi:hypothetical protein